MKSSKYIFYILSIVLVINSCKSDDDMSEFPTKYARITQKIITVKTEIENKVTIFPVFDSEETAKGKFIWSVDKPELVRLEPHTDNSLTLVGLVPGQTTLKIESEDGKLKYFSTLNVLKAFPFKNPIFIDFGDILSAAPFNNFKVSDMKLDKLKDMEDAVSDYSIAIDGVFGTFDRNLPNTLGFPSEVSDDLFFNDGKDVASSRLVLSLNKNLKYSFIFFSTINDINTQNEYRVKGKGEEVVTYLNTAYNTSNVAVVRDITPDDSERITITLCPGPDNTHWAKFYCINAMIILPENYELTFPLTFE